MARRTGSADVVVIGGGVAGLAASLLLGRRGFRVALVERDADPPDATADDDFERWHRPGVPQARQSHTFLGLGCRVLAQEAPDVVDALRSRGVLEVPAAFRGLGALDTSDAVNLLARRLVFEAVLRREVLRERHVELIAGDEVVGLNARSAPSPTVTGVTTKHGRNINAALVVDATGRRSSVPAWTASLGIDELRTTSQHLGLQYLTRFYRLRPDAEFPSTDVPLRDELGYLIALAFAADNETFSLTIVCLVADPLRRALTDPDVFERALRALPLTRPWLRVGEPISAVHPMARIENRWRRLIDSDGTPRIGNLVLIGDSAMHTNPTFGRGTSLALAQAQHLARTLDTAASPLEYVADFERWTERNHGEWFATQVEGDQATVQRFEANLRGAPTTPPSHGWAQFFAAMRVLAPTDATAARALARVWHLLSTPTETMANVDLAERVQQCISTGQAGIGSLAEGPDRDTFERIVTSQ